jgi:uncharacterized protein YggU (UPF0235/DUF167 family)
VGQGDKRRREPPLSPQRDTTDETQAPYAAELTGIRLAVRLTPRGGRDALDGVMRGADGRAALQVRLAAPPVEGAGNAALIAFLASALGLRKADITIRSGTTARLKILHLAGDPADIAARLAAWIG